MWGLLFWVLGVKPQYTLGNGWFSVTINESFGGVIIYGIDPSYGVNNMINLSIARNYQNEMGITGVKGNFDQIKIKGYTYYFHEPGGLSCVFSPICGHAYTITISPAVPDDAQDVTL